MLFNSIGYTIFLPIVLFIYWMIPDRYRWPLLLVASYYFYMSWNIKYVFLIILITVVSYLAEEKKPPLRATNIRREVLING